jgi:hypothetical protein
VFDARPMKSVIAISPGELAILDTPQPKPGPYQALVRTDSELPGQKLPGMEGEFSFADFITRRFLRERIAGAFQVLRGRKVIESVFKCA